MEEPLEMQLMVLKALVPFTETRIQISTIFPQQNHLSEYVVSPARMIFAAAFLACVNYR